MRNSLALFVDLQTQFSWQSFVDFLITLQPYFPLAFAGAVVWRSGCTG